MRVIGIRIEEGHQKLIMEDGAEVELSGVSGIKIDIRADGIYNITLDLVTERPEITFDGTGEMNINVPTPAAPIHPLDEIITTADEELLWMERIRNAYGDRPHRTVQTYNVSEEPDEIIFVDGEQV